MSGSREGKPAVRERLAAVSAIVALGAAVVFATIRAAKNWDSLLVTLVGVVVIVTSGWYVVSRRGTVRLVAGATAAVGVALLVTGFILADLNATAIVLICLFSGLSVVAARYALHESPTSMHRVPASRNPVPPARHPVLIMNLKSGGGKAARFHLVEECHRRGIDPIVLGPGDDLLQLAEDAVMRGADVIGMAGGDGSQALVATVAIRRDVPHVVVPAGTRNHFALDLGLDRDDVVGALDAFNDGVEERVDVARVNGRIFVNNASLGLYARIVRSPEYRNAKRQTAAAMLPDLLGPDAVPLDLRFSAPDGTVQPTAQMILVSNNPYQLDQLGGRGTRERMDLGALGVAAAQIRDARDVRRFVALEAAGKVRRFPGWIEWATPEFRIESEGPVDVGVDGEALQMDPPLVFETMPRALRIRLPRHTIGRSPAAQAIHLVSRSTILELGRTISGRAPG